MGQKLTVPAKAPVALFAEPEVLCDAPSVLSLSGIGDILGKYVCIFDWKVANLLTGERYDPYIEKMERDAIKGLIETDYHDKAFVSKLMECLVLSGIAIQQFGNTVPHQAQSITFLISGKCTVPIRKLTHFTENR